MGIAKQAFYEGAALYLVARAGRITSIEHQSPFYKLNKDLLVLLKYCTKGRSPWGFTFTADEQQILARKASDFKVVLGLICGADGVAAVDYESYIEVAPIQKTAVHISCYRKHGEHYEVNGPEGSLNSKVSPSLWQKII